MKAKDTHDPNSLLEQENRTLLKKLARCHRAMKIGIHIIRRLIEDETHWEGCEKDHPTCMAIALMHNALTDKGD